MIHAIFLKIFNLSIDRFIYILDYYLTITKCNASGFQYYYHRHISDIVIEHRHIIAELLYTAETNISKHRIVRIEKIKQTSKRRIILSTATGTFWNSDSLYHDQFMASIKTPLSLKDFMDVVQETRKQTKMR
jgi:hypothetical protein